ncbi:hypothetical protein [Flavobacterium sp. N3904]|uniref:hypothetical protein n=1 Tax=Flavobacterium sp. N3904 TaxID=2986835 RepID=UPI00222505A5|nr:hypothetical protein [Flavobacterium sp. N3904]
MKKNNAVNIAFTALLIIFTILQSQKINAQGCVAVRQMGGLNMTLTNSYNLNKGDFQVGANYRYFHSWRHFVGKEEQLQRQTTGGGIGPDGKQQGNAVNIYSNAIDFSVAYGVTNRLQVYAVLPYVHNERSQVLRQKTPVIDTLRYSVYAQGIADVRIGVNYWLFDPLKLPKGNIMIGLGIKLNTGSHNVTDDAPQTDGTIKNVIMDQAIQPGDGGIGFSPEFQAFRQLTGRLYGFANAYYLFNPKESNGTFKSDPKPGLEGYEIYACPDQYFARGGLMVAVDKNQNFNVSLAGRIEGIPAYDAFGGQVAYRRPGYVIAVEYGFAYTLGRHGFSLFIPYNIVKNRIQSAADIATQDLQNSTITDPNKYVHVQGDAAFADYSFNLGYFYRFGLGKKKT